MNSEQFRGLNKIFQEYADSFIDRSSQPSPLVLKKEHTMRVCGEIDSLAQELSLNENEQLLARTMALFHDLGRFRQFEKYNTFLDMQSENHARLSLLEMQAHGILNGFPQREKSLIRGAIAVHNAARIPGIKDLEKLFFMKLLRDADKLDIWRVVTEHYLFPDPENQVIVNLGLEDHGACSTEAMAALTNHTYVKSHCIRELNDLKLMQISWVFDLNFPHSVAKVKQRQYVNRLVGSLSMPLHHPGLSHALDGVYSHMDEQTDMCESLIVDRSIDR